MIVFWQIIQQIGFVTFLFFTIYFVIFKKYESLVVLYFFSFPFQSFYIYWVTIWFPYKIVTLGMLIVLFIEYKKILIPHSIIILSALLIIIVICSNIIASIFPPNWLGYYPKVRLLIQDYTYISAIIPLLYISLLKFGFLESLTSKYLLAIEIIIIIGLVHYFFITFDIPFTPILRQDGSFHENALATWGGQKYSRIYGFCGEPKNLAFTILPYIVIQLYSYSTGIIRKSKKYHIIFVLSGLLVLLKTYSSAALITFVLAIPILILIFRIKVVSITYKLVYLIFLIMIFYTINLFVYSNSNYVDNSKKINSFTAFVDAFNERTFERARNELEGDRQEVKIFNQFINEKNVAYLLGGYGIAQYTFHLPGMIGKNNFIIPVQSGLLLTLVDFGVLGVVFWIFYISFCWKLTRKSKFTKNYYSTFFLIATIVTIISSFMYGNLVSSFFFFAMAYYGVYPNRKVKK